MFFWGKSPDGKSAEFEKLFFWGKSADGKFAEFEKLFFWGKSPDGKFAEFEKLFFWGKSPDGKFAEFEKSPSQRKFSNHRTMTRTCTHCIHGRICYAVSAARDLAQSFKLLAMDKNEASECNCPGTVDAVYTALAECCIAWVGEHEQQQGLGPK